MEKQNKITIIIFFLLIHFFSFSPAQKKDEILIRKVLENQQISWNNGDIPRFMKGYWKSDSLMFVSKSGVTYGWLTTLDHYTKSYPDSISMGKLNFTLLHLNPLANHYFFVVGKWYLKRRIGDLQGYFTLLFKKINKQWKIIVDHTD